MAEDEKEKKGQDTPKKEAAEKEEPQVNVDALPLVKRGKEAKGELIEDDKYCRGEITFIV